jgi:hypothetical protein
VCVFVCVGVCVCCGKNETNTNDNCIEKRRETETETEKGKKQKQRSMHAYTNGKRYINKCIPLLGRNFDGNLDRTAHATIHLAEASVTDAIQENNLVWINHRGTTELLDLEQRNVARRSERTPTRAEKGPHGKHRHARTSTGTGRET